MIPTKSSLLSLPSHIFSLFSLYTKLFFLECFFHKHVILFHNISTIANTFQVSLYKRLGFTVCHSWKHWIHTCVRLHDHTRETEKKQHSSWKFLLIGMLAEITKYFYRKSNFAQKLETRYKVLRCMGLLYNLCLVMSDWSRWISFAGFVITLYS